MKAARTASRRGVGPLAPHGASKPEAVLLASHRSTPDGNAVAEVLVLSDGPANGSPRLYTVTIPG